MRKASFLLAFGLAMLLPALAQAPPAARKIDNEFIQRQFGNQFTLVPEFQPAFGDLDGDGIEDVAIAARCKNPMVDQAEHNYTVVDPYYDFFGYGDPKLTTTFSEPDPKLRGLVVLIIDGADKGGWQSATPKAKYVIVNLPYKTLSVKKMRTRKRNVEAIYVEEAGEMGGSSAVFFDGKKFRYVPMGGDMQ
ncbi:MAG: hypothetical protein ABSC07_16215 [Terriglobales bacterium]|jgi:hypothetical protein